MANTSRPGANLSRAIPAAVLFVALNCAVSGAKAIVAKPRSVDSGPCTVTIYWDDTWAGCDSVHPESERGALLEAAGENAIAVMRAWRRRRPELIVPEGQDSSADEPAAAEGYSKFAEILRHEMAGTTSVDSMAAMIASDSIGESDAVLRSRFWLARSVRDGYGPISRLVGWVEYRGAWAKSGDRWMLRNIVRTDGLEWVLGTETADAERFPAREGLRMTMVDIQRRSESVAAEGTIGGGGSERIPIAEEAVPVTTREPVYPEFAREAQIRGTVVVRALVTADGRVAKVEIVEGVTGLNDAAMDAVRHWIFKPALDREGKPAKSWTRVEVKFR